MMIYSHVICTFMLFFLINSVNSAEVDHDTKKKISNLFTTYISGWQNGDINIIKKISFADFVGINEKKKKRFAKILKMSTKEYKGAKILDLKIVLNKLDKNALYARYILYRNGKKQDNPMTWFLVKRRKDKKWYIHSILSDYSPLNPAL